MMRQHHVAGEKAFVDYSGKRIGIADPTTGEIREAEIFVGVLGASNLTYAEATWTQTLPDWTGAHVRMFRFFGGAPKLLVPDNLKSGVTKASFYDPEINRTYGAMAAHYSVGILPARPRRPRDKAKVEAGVRFAQTYILGRLRALTFFSLAECNEADRARHATHERASHAPPRPVSRRELFETIERDALTALPADDWEFAEWRRARVNLDYHIEVDDFFYSVPHALIRAEVDVRITARMVEIFHRGQRVAVHQRRTMGRKHGTDPDHMPSAHRRYAVDAGSLPALGRQDRAEHRGLDHRRARQPAASRAGVPHLPRNSALLSRARRRPRRGGLGPRRRNGRPQLQERRLAPRPQVRPVGRRQQPVALFDHANLRGPRYFN